MNKSLEKPHLHLIYPGREGADPFADEQGCSFTCQADEGLRLKDIPPVPPGRGGPEACPCSPLNRLNSVLSVQNHPELEPPLGSA